MVQWLRIRLPMQGTWVQSLVWEDPTCLGATEPECLELVLRNKKSHCSEEPMDPNWRAAPTGSSPHREQPLTENSPHGEQPPLTTSAESRAERWSLSTAKNKYTHK